MRAIVQRVHAASVEVDGEEIGRVDRGLCVFVGAGKHDQPSDLSYIANKIVNLRIFPDEQGKMSLCVKDVAGGVLAISQFTVYGDVRRGRRPSFDAAMAPAPAREAFDEVVSMIRDRGVDVATGRFAASMRVRVDNDGPVSILIDSAKDF